MIWTMQQTQPLSQQPGGPAFETSRGWPSEDWSSLGMGSLIWLVRMTVQRIGNSHRVKFTHREDPWNWLRKMKQGQEFMLETNEHLKHLRQCHARSNAHFAKYGRDSTSIQL